MRPEQGMQVRLKAGFLMKMQAHTGVAFDLERGMLALRIIKKGMANIERIVRPHLPTVYLSKTEYNKRLPPAKPFKQGKKGATHSNNFIKWCWREGHVALTELRHNTPLVVLNDHHSQFTDQDLPITRIGEYTPSQETTFDLWSNAHMVQLKKHLQEVYGWRPTLWNYKKDKAGKKAYDRNTREPIKVSPKFQENGEMCPNLESLGERVRFVSGIVKWVQLKHRRGILQKKDGTGGWLGNERVQREGRITAAASAITNTMRQKHTIVCNTPRSGSFMGGILRSSLTHSKGMVCVGYDATSIEALIKAHCAYRYDGGEYARKVASPRYDDHIDTALGWGLITPEGAKLFCDVLDGTIPEAKAKESDLWKPTKLGRNDVKPGNYGLQYMQKPKGLADTYGISIEEAEQRYNIYWQINHGWRSCIDNIEKHWELMGKKGIVCPTSGLYLHARGKNSLGSLLIQHIGAFTMDLAGVIMDKWLGGIICDTIPYYKYKGKIARRLIYYHDEYLWECEPEIAEELLELGKESIREAGRVLNLRVPLDADGVIGANWKECH